METKIIEIRDRYTFIPAIAIKPDINADSVEEKYLWRRAGFMVGTSVVSTAYVLLGKLSNLQMEYNSQVWGDRTMCTAHKYLEEHWDAVISGDVVDVEFILGEADKPKESERIDNA